MARKDSQARLIVQVVDVNGAPIGKAAVEFVSRAARRRATVRLKGAGHFYSGEVPPVPGELRVSSGGFEAQARDVSLASGDNQELFVLGRKGAKYYYREKVRVPVDAPANLYGLTLEAHARGASVVDVLGSLNLKPEPASTLAERLGMAMFRAPARNAGALLERVSRHPAVDHAGAVVSLREGGNFSHLTRDVIVRFRGPRLIEVQGIAKELGFEVTRDIVYSPRTYVLRWLKPATLDLLDSVERLAEREDVEWAEPSLAITPELDSITPNDFLWPGLWDRQLIGLPDAWQHLQDAGLDAFGDPNVLLAVWDSGTQSVAGVPTNDDFSGDVSNGQPKLLATFDFINMVANNDSPWDTHGSGVAGVSVARANNPSPVLGQGYGVVGSAPNVQIMTLIGTASVDLYVADQYIWMAGFDPQSPRAGFPATPPPRGADVITCSLTPGAGSPLSGIARATLDFVTTFGRGGKGTMCFFSTGNANQNNVTARPYGAYEKCFGIAAISYANDGVTEIRAPYSGWGQIAFCSPSQDQAPTVHNPPTGFMPWGATHAGQGNMPSYSQTQTSLAAAAVAGANTVTLAAAGGFAVGSVIHLGPIGAVGSEPARITALNAATGQATLAAGLLNAHASGDVVQTGPANHINNFGGTSSATPLCAGVAALVLSANPELTYIEARQVMRETAVKLDLGNTDPVGQWLDAAGNPSLSSGQPAVRSQWYGYGRVNAAAAVQEALTYGLSRDLVIRDNLADTGLVASAGAFWNSPDIWCRTAPPGSDPGAIPANYATAGPHQSPVRGQSNWIYARVRNTGTLASLDAWVRLSVTHFPGLEFTWPESFQPSNGPGDPLPAPMTPGTYFIGEAKVTAIAPGGDQIVSVEWPAGLIPPASVATPSGTVNWHPCLLAEITPHDGPAATGNHVWDDNNLGQKNISIVDADDADVATAMVAGNAANRSDLLFLDIYRGRLPRAVTIYLDLLDPNLLKPLRSFEPHVTAPAECCCCCARAAKDTARPGRRRKPVSSALEWDFIHRGGTQMLALRAAPHVRVPLYLGAGRLAPFVVRCGPTDGLHKGAYEIVIVQRDADDRVSGSAAIELHA